MREAELLRKAREKVAAGWCQYKFAEDNEGNEISCTAPDAAKYSMLGAVLSVCDDPPLERKVAGFLALVIEGDKRGSLTHCNDRYGRTREEVLAKYDAAILLAEKGGAR